MVQGEEEGVERGRTRFGEEVIKIAGSTRTFVGGDEEGCDASERCGLVYSTTTFALARTFFITIFLWVGIIHSMDAGPQCTHSLTVDGRTNGRIPGSTDIPRSERECRGLSQQKEDLTWRSFAEIPSHEATSCKSVGMRLRADDPPPRTICAT